jgi:hypothetical protein
VKRLRSQSGQLTIEAILIMTILTSLSIYTSRFIKSNGLVADLVEGPWKQHPSMKFRHSSNIGEVVDQ